MNGFNGRCLRFVVDALRYSIHYMLDFMLSPTLLHVLC